MMLLRTSRDILSQWRQVTKRKRNGGEAYVAPIFLFLTSDVVQNESERCPKRIETLFDNGVW